MQNPIVGSLLRETDIKKQSDNDFIKSLLSHPGKEFEIQRRLDNLRGINKKNSNNNNNNNNNNNRGIILQLKILQLLHKKMQIDFKIG